MLIGSSHFMILFIIPTCWTHSHTHAFEYILLRRLKSRRLQTHRERNSFPFSRCTSSFERSKLNFSLNHQSQKQPIIYSNVLDMRSQQHSNPKASSSYLCPTTSKKKNKEAFSGIESLRSLMWKYTWMGRWPCLRTSQSDQGSFENEVFTCTAARTEEKKKCLDVSGVRQCFGSFF